LQTAGEIRRTPVNGRLDQQRYRYCVWKPNPLKNFKMDADQVATELARRYFRWIGPATVSEFQWFSALGAKAAKAALEPLGKDDPRLLLPDDRERLEAFRIPKQAQYALVASLDGVSLWKPSKSLCESGSGRPSQPWDLRSRARNRALGI
jgi:hypothetical protein